MTDAGLEALLLRAMRDTGVVGILASLALWKATSWRNAAMMATGTAISAASIYEWRRLARFLSEQLRLNRVPKGAMVSLVLFLLRLVVFAAAIYVSLKCFQGSVVALLCGLALAVVAIVWEAVRTLRE
jgi:hypothetical protein